nr:MAG TPA: hypothetical protein [Bacteriophage sp.]
MIRQFSVIQERNALIENLTFIIERIDFRKPFLYLFVIAFYHFTPKNTPIINCDVVVLDFVPIIFSNAFCVELINEAKMYICHFFIKMTLTNLALDLLHHIKHYAVIHSNFATISHCRNTILNSLYIVACQYVFKYLFHNRMFLVLLQEILSDVVHAILIFQQVECKVVGILNQMLCTNVLNIFLAEYLCDGTSVVAYDLIHCNVQSIIIVVRLLLCCQSEASHGIEPCLHIPGCRRIHAVYNLRCLLLGEIVLPLDSAKLIKILLCQLWVFYCHIIHHAAHRVSEYVHILHVG